MSARRKGREIALQILYLHEWGTMEDLEDALQEYARSLSAKSLSEQNPALEFARRRLKGVLDRLGELDALLEKHATRWRLDRMASVDRNVLRIGAYELFFCPDIPPKVAINEAVELAKKFGSEESGAFVNGILDAVLRARKEGEIPSG